MTNSAFVKIRKFQLHDDDLLLIGDPCYFNKFANAFLNRDTEDSFNLLASPYTHWEDNQSANLFAVEDDRGTRALVLTLDSEPPKALLRPVLKGQYLLAEYVAVDSGLVGFYGERYVTENEDHKELETLKPALDGYFVSTYIGDGLYPVAIWAKDGQARTIAILTDRTYYDRDWTPIS